MHWIISGITCTCRSQSGFAINFYQLAALHFTSHNKTQQQFRSKDNVCEINSEGTFLFWLTIIGILFPKPTVRKKNVLEGREFANFFKSLEQ